jgi:LysR family glycine cleavage system transcriptional activator
LLLHDDTGELYDNEPFWGRWLKGAGVTDVDANKGPHFSHAVLAFEAAIDGVGVLASMPVLGADDIASGRLVAPFDLIVKLPGGYYMACGEHADERPAVAAFREWLRGEAARPTA